MPPGIYVQDGGATASALGQAIGQLADNLSPEGRARAQLTYQQTGQADVARQQALEILQARRAAEAASSDFLNTFNANPGGGSSVANTVASLAQPPAFTPLSTSTVDTSSFSPIAKMTAARIAQGDFSPAEQAGEVNLGQSATMGPGNTYQAQGDIYKAQHAPHDIAAGTTYLIDPTKGNVPGNAVYGGDPGQLEAEKTRLLTAQKDAETRAGLAGTATDTVSVLNQAENLYDTLAKTGPEDFAAVMNDNARSFLAAHGVNVGLLSSREGAQLAIKQLLSSVVASSFNAVRGDANTPIRGELQQANDIAADPTKLDDNAFHIVLGRMRDIAQHQMEEGVPARKFKNLPQTGDNATVYNTELEGIRARREEENRRKEQAPPVAQGDAGQIYIFPDEATMEAAGAAGNVPKGANVQLGYGANARTGKYQPKVR